MANDPAGTTGVLRITPDQLPRNHHGDQVAPLTQSELPYQLRWVDHVAPRAKPIAQEKWEEHKAELCQLYQSMTLDSLMKTMRAKYGFLPS